VYRFILHPPSEHEDLVVTWLQTEKQGVFSHDTALALHELSDILPVRQHITLPPGWKPVEGMALATNTVVHEGTVPDTEKSWMGPVPFTKPLRTLVDCIDKDLTPDLVIQGIADARRRGMLSHAEAEHLRLANLKSA
jgi:predicted transcriptional regulator of viral defense system